MIDPVWALADQAPPLVAADVVFKEPVGSLPGLYPFEAARNGLGGQGVVACTIRSDGAITACRTRSETPIGSFFGLASEAMGQRLRVATRGAAGESVVGRQIVLSFGFRSENGASTVALQTASTLASLPDPSDRKLLPVSSDDVKWVRPIDGRKVEALYPQGARQRGVSGFGLTSCEVADDGLLFDCRPVAAYPAGFGFDGAAAVAMTASKAKIGSVTTTGEATAHRRIGLLVIFKS
ncbi:MAG: hypothetical protein JSR45_00085 [Proteobacteria bacterium]|nr:hypothetical protein [Pseudomonadota bacterium]